MVKKIRAKVLEKIYDEFSKTLLKFAELNSFEIFTVKGSSHIVLILYVKDFPVFLHKRCFLLYAHTLIYGENRGNSSLHLKTTNFCCLFSALYSTPTL